MPARQNSIAISNRTAIFTNGFPFFRCDGGRVSIVPDVAITEFHEIPLKKVDRKASKRLERQYRSNGRVCYAAEKWVENPVNERNAPSTFVPLL